MLLELSRIQIPPGQRVVLQDITWQEFERVLEELGEHRAARIAYENGLLEIMAPLPEHEDNKEIIGDLIKDLLEELDIEFRSLGSTTYKSEGMLKGIEPDQCFYIQNEPAIRGKKRLDLSIDPPPDLALEIDVTSRTHRSIYAALKVPELWRFENGNLQINILRQDRYEESPESSIFPNLPLSEAIPRYLRESKIVGRNKALKAFRQWVKEQIDLLRSVD
ncbi:Uma2 family endonuclease [Phormidesmis priestleyi ULC007]|uniref:Uma2 family endonuclease n=1 Tax=Phormidesmis priestleyi ULC007 TaxID=1920490 RepID=A0A2T1DL80_9CYAN|nr:Uma2 family endonuclease [Phormidesmis priestleyi]PSB21174.1 Uma2 family endonuclease [Phormidesmis priestleyi ULC007]PZO51299.1 MAG: Uma2 family endonuclease [Phormidesmis priestleyi]